MKKNDGCWTIIGLIMYIVITIIMITEGVNPILAIFWPFLIILVILILMIAA